jgi:hypothetical protein
VVIQNSYPEIGIRKGTFDVISGAAGAKVELFHRLLLTGNVLFQLNNNGLRAKVVPIAGLSYTF